MLISSKDSRFTQRISETLNRAQSPRNETTTTEYNGTYIGGTTYQQSTMCETKGFGTTIVTNNHGNFNNNNAMLQ